MTTAAEPSPIGRWFLLLVLKMNRDKPGQVRFTASQREGCSVLSARWWHLSGGASVCKTQWLSQISTIWSSTHRSRWKCDAVIYMWQQMSFYKLLSPHAEVCQAVKIKARSRSLERARREWNICQDPQWSTWKSPRCALRWPSRALGVQAGAGDFKL